MQAGNWSTFTAALTLAAVTAASAAPPAAVPAWQQAALARDVLLLGERHGRPESIALLRTLVVSALARHGCVSVALEIDSDQQPALDAMAAGEDGVPLRIFHVIDHPSLRALIAELAVWQRSGRCVRTVAADAPLGADTPRDLRMAQIVAAELRQGRFVVGLFGLLHLPRGLRYTYLPEQRTLTEHLEDAGIVVHVLMQHWAPACAGAARMATAEELTDVVGHLRARVNGTLPADPAAVLDATWLWCDSGGTASAGAEGT